MATSTSRTDSAKADSSKADTEKAEADRSGAEQALDVPAVMVDTAEAHTDRVAMVSRDKNGNPDQSDDYELLVADDASDREKRLAENRPADTQADPV